MEKGKDQELALDLAKEADLRGGRSFYVGGYVRDRLLKKENKDIDIEIHGIGREELEEILSSFGELRVVGAEFGIYGIEGFDVDIALPRKEVTVGRGHKDLVVTVDPFMGTKEASKRRDFTINALMEDVLTHEVIDHYGGLCDLKNGILCHVDADTFSLDPLRLLRGTQFAARFEYKISDETALLCQKMDITALPKERVFAELKKALLKARHPSIFFEELRRMDQLHDWFKEIEDLIGIPQNPKYHPEGDVWTHTMCVLDAAAALRDHTTDPLSFMLSALFHDVGKAVTTEEKKGAIHSYGHEQAGIPIAMEGLSRITSETKIIEYVLNMIKLHMKPHNMLYHDSKKKSFNKLFDDSVAPHDLILLARADAFGKKPEQIPVSMIVSCDWIQRQLEEKLNSYNLWMSEPYVEGKDLVAAGLKPGKSFRELLAYAHKLRLAEIPKEDALKQTLAYARRTLKLAIDE